MPERLFTNAIQIQRTIDFLTRRLRRPPLPQEERGGEGSWHRHWVVAGSAPRLTARQAFQSQPASAGKAVYLDRFQKICRTGRFKSTAGAGPAEQGKQGRECAFVKPNKKSNQEKHQGARIEARFTRRNHSSSSAR